MKTSQTIQMGDDLFPRDADERDAFFQAAGHLPRTKCPTGFTGHSAIWARDRTLLVGQAVLVVLSDDTLRPRFAPRGADPSLPIALVDALAVRAEYRETGLEERMARQLIRSFANGAEALVYVGAARAPSWASTWADTDPVDRWLS